MNRDEVVLLIMYVQAACPSQAFDERTPAVWADLLADVRMEDAQHAARILAGRQRYIAPSEILTEVKALRADRLDRTPVPDPPPGLSDSDYQRWLLNARLAIADGRPVETARPIGTRGMPALGTVFRGPDAGP